MNPAPAISVVVPTFNRAEVLPRALGSLRSQTWPDFEVIIVDDGSTDGTSEILARLEDPRFRAVRQENRGVAAARNHGLSRARGEVATFLDSDDEALPDWLASLAEAFADRSVGVVSAGVRVLTPDHREEVTLPAHLSPLCSGQRLCFLAGALASKRFLLEEIGGYGPLGYAENEELALRLIPACLASGHSTVAIDRPLVVYHRDPRPWRSDPRRFAIVRAGAEYILEHHGERLRHQFPQGYSNHRGVAAINAARLGDHSAARRHLAAALRATPWRWKYHLRWALTLMPPLATRFWNRSQAKS